MRDHITENHIGGKRILVAEDVVVPRQFLYKTVPESEMNPIGRSEIITDKGKNNGRGN